jgi:flavin reductase (DIM6/NTAB) family NADH-FMN oxidoreductase RutF
VQTASGIGELTTGRLAAILERMKAYNRFTPLVTAERENRANFKTLLSCVMPRPIAFVSTVSGEGIPNLAPFSFFNGVGSNPPAVIFSPCTKADGTPKDTLVNLRAVGEFVVNVVPHAIRDAMNQASFPYGPDVNEFEAAGFTPLPSRFVRPPRAAESPVHLECRLVQIVPVGGGPLSANICIGEVLCFHVADEILLPDGTCDVAKIDLIGRLGGDDYSTIRDRFALPKPSAPAGMARPN